MGATFSGHESVSQSPNRSRASNDSQPTNQRASANLAPPLRRSSANISSNSNRNRLQNELDDSLDAQIRQILQSDNPRNRHFQFISNSRPSGSGRVIGSFPHTRPYSIGGDLTVMGLSSESDSDHERHSIHARLSLMPYLTTQDRRCSICKKMVPYDNFETHYVMCLTKPRVTFNEDILTEDQGECVICLIDLIKGDIIARLPCLCIYHKGCIEDWFKRNQTCPSHPDFIETPR